MSINSVSSFEKTDNTQSLPFVCHVKLPYAIPYGSDMSNGTKTLLRSKLILTSAKHSQISKRPKAHFLLKHQPFLGHTNMK